MVISSMVSGSVVVTSDDVTVVLEEDPMLIDSTEVAVVSETPGNGSWLVVGGAIDETESATGVACEVTTSTGSLWPVSLASLGSLLGMVVISFSLVSVDDESSELTSPEEMGMAVVGADGSSDSLTDSVVVNN